MKTLLLTIAVVALAISCGSGAQMGAGVGGHGGAYGSGGSTAQSSASSSSSTGGTGGEPIQCPPGTKPCMNVCVSKQAPETGCGNPSCDGCQIAHGEASCKSYMCSVSACDQGWVDCNGAPADGCEIDTTSDIANCGGCGKSCSGAHAQVKCESGMCVLVACDPGWADCNGEVADGCESQLGTPTNCASCGDCAAAAKPSQWNTISDTQCMNGACWFECFNMGTPAHSFITGCDHSTGANTFACDQYFFDCDGNKPNGCETYLGTNSNCGACHVICNAPWTCKFQFGLNYYACMP